MRVSLPFFGGSTFLIASLFAVPSAGTADDATIAQKDLKKSSNNLKQIALAFHIYHDKYTHFPTDITDKDGKALLSWRVAILPFIEQDALYKQFKLNEPWDSDTNKKLIEKMPPTYAPVRVQGKAGETFYQVFTGEDALFGEKKKPNFLGITDGTSNTGMVFEAGDPVVWSKPADLAFDKKKPLPKLGGLFNGDFHVAFCDGSVQMMKKNPDDKELKNLIMPTDGNIVDMKKLLK
jgi:prepilin-type processing-associated H-X9-DG protein